MRVIERQGSRQEEHFTEGEPDLEPPEELAVLEVDEEALLEEDLDKEVDLEDEVDEEILESSLDHLVHDGDEDGDEAPSAVSSVLGDLVVGEDDRSDEAEVDDVEIEDLEDRVESLDRILREKLAGDEGADADAHGSVPEGDVVTSCRTDEFVCPSCFLVRSQTQRADPSGSLCRDCSE